ncbi:MAG: hypothetical protein R3E18_12135 [Sphingomonadaceae bacterium]|nr:hypothetical protein [Sphingomonadaceae bacterium]
MPSFLFAFAATLVTSLGARDQLLVAQLSARLGAGVGLLFTAWLAAILSASIMAWGGDAIAALMPDAGKTMLVAFALAAAAFELAWPNKEKSPREPTRSLVAAFIVLLARQMGDASRFLVFAFAVATGVPLLAGIGGALGGGLALTLGWMAGQDLGNWPLRAIRLGIAVVTGIAALMAGLAARGIIQA